MQIGMIGLGRMGANMVQRLLADGHTCVVYARTRSTRDELAALGAQAVDSLEDMVHTLQAPRPIWIMVPDQVVDDVIAELLGLLADDDIIIDGGNSYFPDDLRRAQSLKEHNIHYVDVGTSGGVWGRERGYCLMIGGENGTVNYLEPIFRTLAPGEDAAPMTPGRINDRSSAHRGYLRCGGHGAGHFVKMVHNGIEYGLMAAYGEGFAMLDKAKQEGADIPTGNQVGPLQLDADTGEIAELWRRGSVVESWLLDLAATSLHQDPQLKDFSGDVTDSGEGRWTVKTAVDLGVPTHVLAAALFNRFSSRGEATYTNKVLSALRFAFGGHVEKS
jgi:6-phosphogluconate dehydrogenase